jgi:hypothetical protein
MGPSDLRKVHASMTVKDSEFTPSATPSHVAAIRNEYSMVVGSHQNLYSNEPTPILSVWNIQHTCVR